MAENIEKQILDFNNDPDVFALRNRYTTKTFLDIMSVSRSENRHSAFLAWLFKGDDFAVAPQDHPIVHLFDIIIKRVADNNEVKGDKVTIAGKENQYKVSNYESLKDIVLTRDIQSIDIIEITPEKTLEKLCGIPKFDDRDGKQYPSNDRIDIYIKCRICTKSKRIEPLEIEFIIENKIGSCEGGKYTKKGKRIDIASDYRYYNLTQTQRYFLANAERTNNTAISSYIFLSPGDQRAISPYFINISYQDILDSVIEPLLLPEVNISDRIRILIEEYISSLSLPAYEQSDEEEKEKQIKNAMIMAVRKGEKEKLDKIWDKYYNTKELLKRVIDIFLENVDEDESAAENSEEAKSDQLLKRFYDVNKSLIIALLRVAIEGKKNNGDQDEQILEDLQLAYQNMIPNKKDNSKFTIIFTDGTDLKKLGKGKLFLEIAKRYIQQYAKDDKLEEPRMFFIKEAFKNQTSYPIALYSPNGGENIIYLYDPLSGNEISKPYSDKEFKARFFKENGKVITLDGRDGQKYIISSQWGVGDVFYKFLEFLGISQEDFKNKPSGKSGETIEINNILKEILGIDKITWTH